MKKKKTALVTGGTSGVGLSIVKGLIHEDYFVVFIGSNKTKGKALEASLGEQNATFIGLDLGNLNEVYRFTEDFVKTHSRLDLLANVAGVILPEREMTPEGFEKTFAVGYLSPFVLSVRLASLLKKTPGSRIVNVSAQARTILNTRLDFENLDFSKAYNGFKASIATVHAKTVLTVLLSEKLHLDVNSFHPGIVRSDLTRHQPFFIRFLTRVFSPLMSKTSQNGIYVCISKDIEGISGQLYVDKKPVPLSFERDYKETLWKKTNELLKTLKFDLYENTQL
ncbi:SDR family NAD(P)-dependent oxidoreductase [Emticicia sp. CRIBPO]|uniref:SDR family NAD(P)-dependent oxidoreductase n=1 Tax=Emticicia sp. CRIBPO TaxID=2683258 RepID=UPI00141288FA|nr:SDR family NAD(P)-dependent oxidoreductase [Emticicia sp. CRIBPO]NBA84623.1 SDR family NAD(P)-dependent oxidoreductase [Emticicia sp. CRIBPO]